MDVINPLDYPKASYRVVAVVEGKSPAFARTCFDLSLDRPLNGFDATSLSLDMPKDAAQGEVEKAILRCVNWNLLSRTGLSFPASRVVNETVGSAVKVETEPLAPPLPPVPAETGDPAMSNPVPSVDGVAPPVEGEPAPVPVS